MQRMAEVAAAATTVVRLERAASDRTSLQNAVKRHRQIQMARNGRFSRTLTQMAGLKVRQQAAGFVYRTSG